MFWDSCQTQEAPPSPDPPPPKPNDYPEVDKPIHIVWGPTKLYHDPVWNCYENDRLWRKNLTSIQYTVMCGTHKELVNAQCFHM